MSVPIAHVPWSHQATIYAVNIRQYTPEGTLAAFEAQLPRLQKMGVTLVWLLPIQPIGRLNRKGTLGSYYSIADYTAVNPEFGTLADFKRLVNAAHALGMKLILDWVANHTAWDHAWVGEHPDWYKKDSRGEIHAYTYRATPDSEPEYWTDVVGLDYAKAPALWPAMIEAMRFWRSEAGIDGFRCDVAALVPLPFWRQARAALERDGPLFMLAEAHEPELHAAFDMTYDWDLYDQLKAVAQGKAQAQALRDWWQRRQAHYAADDYRMIYTANHDSNSWHGCDAELFGSLVAFKAMSVLAATLPGMPLVYGGQEAYFEKRLQFFEKDPIDWKGRALEAHYTELLALKAAHPALGNGAHGGDMAIHETGNEAVFAFTRECGGDAVSVCVNLGAEPQSFTRPGGARGSLGAWEWGIDTP
jgi:glycosidase